MYSISVRNGGQSVAMPDMRQTRSRADRAGGSSCTVCLVPTDLGWFALWGDGDTLFGLTIGQPSAAAARDSFRQQWENRSDNTCWQEADWNPALRRMLQDFARGDIVDFSEVIIAHPELTTFQRDVLEATRRIPYGETRTYAALAEEAGHPRAARAVGNVMARNRVPIIVPCHRVVASGGKWGGFSAPQGVSLKRRILDMEAEAVCVDG